MVLGLVMGLCGGGLVALVEARLQALLGQVQKVHLGGSQEELVLPFGEDMLVL